jgi:hypothetical protein
MYGYMRFAGHSHDEYEGNAVKGELAAYAEREGYTLEQVFIEQAQVKEAAIDRMTAALRMTGVRDVIVPSLWHFARLPGLQKAMCDHIAKEIGARIWVVQGVRQ